MDARQSLHSGEHYPFDAPDEWIEMYSASRLPPEAKDYAHRAARGIVANLMDRRGVKNGFNRIDEDMRIDIVEDIAAIVREAVKDELRPKTIAVLRRLLPDWHEDAEPNHDGDVMCEMTFGDVRAIKALLKEVECDAS